MKIKPAYLSLVALVLPIVAARANELTDDAKLPSVEVLSCVNQCKTFVSAKSKLHDLPEFPRSVDGPFNPHAEGYALVGYTVDEDGRVRDVEPIYVLGPRAFADKTCDTIRTWTFEPATLDGKPVRQRRLVRLTYEATSLVSGTRVDTKDIIKELVNSPSESKREAAVSKLRAVFENPLINRGERTTIALVLAQEAIRNKDYLEARRLAILGTIWPGSFFNTIKALSLIRIQADLFLGEIADALAIKAEMSEPGHYDSVGNDPTTIALIAPIFDLIDKTRAKIDAMPQFTIQAKVSDGPETKVAWHIFYHRVFGFHVTSGTLDKFILGCSGGLVESKITESAQWQIPKSWSVCSMYVYGSPGTKFNIIEGTDAMAQSTKDASP